MLAQGQEVFLEKQVADGKKSGLLAKLASQAAYLYGQAAEGVQENVTKGIFEKSWLALVHVSAQASLIMSNYRCQSSGVGVQLFSKKSSSLSN